MIRSFIAIELPQEIRDTLAAIQGQLKPSQAKMRWVNPNGIHLTLKFLGNIHPAQVAEIAETAAIEIKNEPPLTLRPLGLGAFPNLRNPRVLWVGIIGEVERLGNIQTCLETGLERLGFAREQRPFRPHLTLGRLKDRRRNQALVDAIDTLQLPEFNSFDVAEIILYKSDLRPTGAIYTKLHRMPLSASASP